MWHEARKQEKKLRCMIVDYRKRAERRREFYEKFKADPTQFMQVHGRPSKIYLEPQIAASAENCMMPWQGNADNLIDRFDVRAHLDIIPEWQSTTSGSGKSQAVEEEEQNPGINYERYRILIQNDLSGTSEDKFLHQIHLEEQFGNSATSHSFIFGGGKHLPPKVPKAAIGYNYEDSTPAFTVAIPKGPPGGGQSGGAATGEAEEESEEEIDFDLLVNVDDLTHGQKAELNNFGTKYGLGAGDFMEYLNGDLEEKEKLRLAKLHEEEKQAMSGRKARRERRAYKDKLIMKKGYISPPSYATYAAPPSPSAEDPEAITTPSKRSSSRSESRSRSNSPEKITFITSFGGNESEDGEGGGANRHGNTSGGRPLPFESSNSRHAGGNSGTTHPVFGPSLPPASERKGGGDSHKRGRFISRRSRSLDFMSSSSSHRRRSNRSRSRSNSRRRSSRGRRRSSSRARRGGRGRSRSSSRRRRRSSSGRSKSRSRSSRRRNYRRGRKSSSRSRSRSRGSRDNMGRRKRRRSSRSTRSSRSRSRSSFSRRRRSKSKSSRSRSRSKRRSRSPRRSRNSRKYSRSSRSKSRGRRRRKSSSSSSSSSTTSTSPAKSSSTRGGGRRKRSRSSTISPLRRPSSRKSKSKERPTPLFAPLTKESTENGSGGIISSGTSLDTSIASAVALPASAFPLKEPTPPPPPVRRYYGRGRRGNSKNPSSDSDSLLDSDSDKDTEKDGGGAGASRQNGSQNNSGSSSSSSNRRDSEAAKGKTGLIGSMMSSASKEETVGGTAPNSTSLSSSSSSICGSAATAAIVTVQQGVGVASMVPSSSVAKLTPKERLRRKMQSALTKTFKADKEAEKQRQVKQFQERMEREESLRELTIKYRRREREKRHRDREIGGRSSSSSGGESSRSSRSHSRSPSRSPPPPEVPPPPPQTANSSSDSVTSSGYRQHRRSRSERRHSRSRSRSRSPYH